MNFTKRGIVFFLTIVGLLLCIFFIVYTFIGGTSKEVKAAKSFIGVLYSEDIVVESEDQKLISYESTKKNDSSNGNEYYVVNTRDFGIDVDSNYNIIGFKNKVSTVGEVKVSKEEAIKLAEKYLGYIYEGDFKFKEFIEEEGAVTPYYSLVFTKFKNGYPFYKDQIVVSIDKENGKLDGYSNITTQGDPKKIKVDVNISEAEENALKEFLTLNESGEVVGETFKAFFENKDKTETELCFVVTLKGVGIDGKEAQWKYFVSTDSGKIINILKDTVKETKAVG